MRDITARLGWIAMAVAIIVMWIWAAIDLPDRVPAHFNGRGDVDRWSSKTELLVFDAVMAVVVMVGLPLLGWVLARGSGTFVNIPDKDYWFTPEHQPTLQRMLWADMLFMAALTGALLVAMMGVVHWSASNDGASPPAWVFWVLITTYVVVVGAWTFDVVTRRYRRPDTGPGSES